MRLGLLPAAALDLAAFVPRMVRRRPPRSRWTGSTWRKPDAVVEVDEVRQLQLRCDAGSGAVDDGGAAAGVGGGGRGQRCQDGGSLTPCPRRVRRRIGKDAADGADINETSGYGWSPLLVATQNRYYKLGAFLLDHGADPNLANKGGWVPLYLATDNRNIESGDYPVRKGDMDHLDFIKLLLDKGANVNARIKDSTETRTVFTNQWLDEQLPALEAGATNPFDVADALLARSGNLLMQTD